MYKRIYNYLTFFLSSFFLIVNSTNAASPIIVDTLSKFPCAVVSPSVPDVGESIKLRYILGMYPDGCIPVYKTSISKTVVESYPQVIKFDLKYEEIPSDRKDKACITVMTPYGPSFDLGIAESGAYEIYINDKIVTQFKVTSPAPLKFSPENLFEGDSVVVNQILGYGSSSCSPFYKSSYELSIGNDDQYTIKLTYSVTDRSDQEVCTADYRPYGPEWKIPPLNAGHYNIYLNNKFYISLTVQSKSITPAHVSIEGMVGLGGLIDAMRYPYVAQCTVAVITFQKFPSGNLEKLEMTRYYGVTDAHGNYTIKNVPVSVLKSNSFIAAVKRDSVGYARLTDQLTERMVINLVIYNRNKTEDSVLVNDGEEIINIFKTMLPALSVNNKVLLIENQPVITAVPGGFQIVNPVSQALTITAFSMNGKKIWSTSEEKLISGNYKFRIPAVSSGVVLMNVKGEFGNFSKLLKMTR